jgi:hypothetical protein
MKIAHSKKDDLVMSYGDLGHNFYFIIQGEVEIIVPHKDRLKKF